MNYILLQNIGYRHDNGDVQFQQIHFSLPEGLTGLVGANGVGKSLLGKIICGQVRPDSGTVTTERPMFYLPQNILKHLNLEQTVAQFCAAHNKLQALDNLQQGIAREQDYEVIGDDWLFAQHFQSQLNELGAGLSANKTLASLSGGELIKLMLAQLFIKAKNQQGCLLLDEPSNHLDYKGKLWLSEQLAEFNEPCLLISHDRQLLDLCDHIGELKSHEVRLTQGNYQRYFEQKTLQQEAELRQFQHLKKQQKQAQKQAQRDIEKAQQRAANGQKQRQKGGQPKITLNAKGEKAQSSLAAKQAQHRAISHRLNERIDNVLIDRDPNWQTLIFDDATSAGKRLLQLQNYHCTHLQRSIDWNMKHGDKVHVKGENGCGKSTLLHMLQQAAPSLSSDTLAINTEVLLLDQHCSFIRDDMNLVDNLTQYIEPPSGKVDIRTLLASNGFRKDTVFQLAASLSGGEKMRLAMLVASCQTDKLLLLDEPDNHLDIDSKTLLAKALRDFNGSFMLVSHDQSFVDECGVSAVLNL